MVSGPLRQDVQAGTGTPQAVSGAPSDMWADASTPGEPFCLGTVVFQQDRSDMLCGGFPLCRTSSVVDTDPLPEVMGSGLESPRCLHAAGGQGPSEPLNPPWP